MDVTEYDGAENSSNECRQFRGNMVWLERWARLLIKILQCLMESFGRGYQFSCKPDFSPKYLGTKRESAVIWVLGFLYSRAKPFAEFILGFIVLYRYDAL